MDTIIGEQILLYRRRAGWSQAELAKKARVSRNVIATLEVGKGNPTLETLRAIGKALKLDVRVTFEEKQ